MTKSFPRGRRPAPAPNKAGCSRNERRSLTLFGPLCRLDPVDELQDLRRDHRLNHVAGSLPNEHASPLLVAGVQRRGSASNDRSSASCFLSRRAAKNGCCPPVPVGHVPSRDEPEQVTNGRSAFDCIAFGSWRTQMPRTVRDSLPPLGWGRPGRAIYFAAAIRAARWASQGSSLTSVASVLSGSTRA